MINNDNVYYVYLHRRNDNKKIFYVGKGTGDRAFSQRSRNRHWNSVFKQAGGCFVEFVAFGLTEKQAFDMEIATIEKYRDTLVNKNNNSKEIKLSYDILNHYFYYDETSPTYLRWKVPVGRGCQTKRYGDVAGYVGKFKNGKMTYARVNLDGKTMLVHRVIWVLHNKKDIPEGYQINHINCDSFDNRIDNLELVTNKQNQNLKRKKSGYKILKNKEGNAISVQVSYLDESGKRRCRNFRLKGSLEETVEEALSFKREMVEKFFLKST